MKPVFDLHGSQIFLGSIQEYFPRWIAQRPYTRLFVLTDENTTAACLPYFRNVSGKYSQEAGNWFHLSIPAGEAHKNLHTCAAIWQAFLSAELDRKALVVNLGGGVTGDMGGFCAATWKRGLDFVQIPTTLLSMTDAAIGGKTGVDFQGIKNAIGVIKQPAAVFVDTVFLNTLPVRERKSGLAEVIKHFAISGALDKNLDDLERSIGVKVRIVHDDPHEKGLRMLLNFGHTIGHAIESYFLNTAMPLTHGEAIAIGMICETAILAEKEGAPAFQGPLEKIILENFQFQPVLPEATGALWKLMLQDKKNASGKVRMALPDAAPWSIKIVETDQQELERSLLYFNCLLY